MIYVVIPVHNRKQLLKGCLRSFEAQSNRDFRIIVVDDGSSDGTDEMLRSEFPDVITLKGDGNLWWTGAINKGIKHALSLCRDDDYILVINDDLEVPTDYIANYYALAGRYPAALIGSVVTDFDERDTIVSGGVQLNWITGKRRELNVGKSLSSFGRGHVEDNVSFLTGRGTLIPVEVFRRLGIYNNNHYTQCGDTEFPVRARKAGYQLLVSYDVPVFSHEGHSVHKEEYTLASLKSYFFDIRSHVNLRERFWFAIDSTANIFHGLWFFMMDFTRITVHFFRKLKMPWA
ncbi:MAG TPA: glycosyltransferase family 2 protein [Cyclobacteriaceae bacterium]|jgi:GT2 family glycosyltransferase|nr:glycosyltransferase family 2 protein [Cyclobacteriaceae bacterium]